MDNINPKVSIIVPTYNVEKYARTCFDSLINQSLKDIEIILVDDGSTDTSGDICEEYAKKDSRIKVIHQTNRGLGLTRNSGLEVATGEYIGFVDSDDFISAKMYEVLYENARRECADISYCKYSKFVNEDEVEEINQIDDTLKVWKGQSDIRQYMLDRIGMSPSSKADNLYGASVCVGIFSKKFLDKINARFISERQYISEDMIFDIDVIPNSNKIVHCNNVFYYYRYNPISLTTTYKNDRYYKNVELYKEMYRRLEKYYDKQNCFNSMSRYLLTTARIALIQEAQFINQNGKKIAERNIYNICCEEELQNVLRKYKYWKLPLKYAIVCFLEKNKCAKILLFIVNVLYGAKR